MTVEEWVSTTLDTLEEKGSSTFAVASNSQTQSSHVCREFCGLLKVRGLATRFPVHVNYL